MVSILINKNTKIIPKGDIAARMRFKTPMETVIDMRKSSARVHGAASIKGRLIVPQESPATICWKIVTKAWNTLL